MKYELILWEDIKNDMHGFYEDSDDNKGFVFGINVLDEDSDEVVGVQWFKTEQERADALQENEEKL